MTHGFPSPSCSTFFDFELFFVGAFFFDEVVAASAAAGDPEPVFAFFFAGFASSSESLRVMVSTRFFFGGVEAAAAGEEATRRALRSAVVLALALAEVEATGDDVDAFVGEAMLANIDWMLPFFSKSGCDVVSCQSSRRAYVNAGKERRNERTHLDEFGGVVSNGADFGGDSVAVELAGVGSEERFDGWTVRRGGEPELDGGGRGEDDGHTRVEEAELCVR